MNKKQQDTIGKLESSIKQDFELEIVKVHSLDIGEFVVVDITAEDHKHRTLNFHVDIDKHGDIEICRERPGKSTEDKS